MPAERTNAYHHSVLDPERATSSLKRFLKCFDAYDGPLRQASTAARLVRTSFGWRIDTEGKAWLVGAVWGELQSRLEDILD